MHASIYTCIHKYIYMYIESGNIRQYKLIAGNREYMYENNILIEYAEHDMRKYEEMGMTVTLFAYIDTGMYIYKCMFLYMRTITRTRSHVFI